MRKAAILILALILLLTVFSGCKDKSAPDEVTPPKKLISFTDGNFRIVQFSDFHEWLGEYKDLDECQLMETMKPPLESYIDAVLNHYSPDLVILTGDNMFSRSFLYDFGSYEVSIKTYKRIAQVFEDKSQYWTMTFGNHDSESAKTKKDFYNAVKDFRYFIGGTHNTDSYSSFVYESDDRNNAYTEQRYCNFSIPVYNDRAEVKYNIYLLDSGSYNYKPPSSLPYKYILDIQTEWYKSRAEQLISAYGGPVPSLMFTHIPLFEHREAYLQGGEYIGEPGGFSISDTRSSIFEEAFNMGDIRGIFCGHNHGNSITCFYQRDGRKIMMGVTPQASAESYFDDSPVMRCRVLDLKEDGNFITFIDTSDEEYAGRIEYGQKMSYEIGIIED